MKVLVIGFTHPNYMPYMHHYLKLLNDIDNIEVSIAYWKRTDTKINNISINGNFFEYYKKMSDTINIFRKIPYIYSYSRFLKKIIKDNHFDKLIVLHTTTAFIIRRILSKKYRKNYIFDYRDVTYERLKLYKIVVQKIVRESSLTISSSRGFDKYININNNLNYIHNITPLISTLDKVKSKRIVIRFWGFIRQVEFNKRIIKAVSKDVRFELHYHGKIQRNYEQLKEYSESIKAKNVFFNGEYLNEERERFAERTDLIHNIYDNDFVMESAISNKFYDGILMKIPQICNENSYMGKIINDESIGININVNDPEFLQKIHLYYTKINHKDFELNCDRLIDQYNKENELTNEKINYFMEVNNV